MAGGGEAVETVVTWPPFSASQPVMASLLREVPDWAVPVLFLAAYFVIMRWVLPSVGVPT